MQVAVIEVAKQYISDRAELATVNLLPEVNHPNLLIENIEPEDETVEEVCLVDAPMCETQNVPTLEQIEADREAKWAAIVSERIFFAQAAWNGVYSGLYGMKHKKEGVQKPTEECFGDWIIED